MPCPKRARHRAEGRGALALAVAGDDEEQAAFVGGGADGSVDQGFFTCHTRGMAGIAICGFSIHGETGKREQGTA